MNKTDLLVQPAQLDAEALEAYERCLRHDTTCGLQSVREVLDGAMLFDIRDGADQVALRYAPSLQRHAHGRELVVLAAAGGARGQDMTRRGMEAILYQAEGCADVVSVFTRRKGMVKKLGDMGFSLEAFKLSKRVKPCN